MILLRASRYGGQAGFALIELLIALAISSLVAAGIAGMVPASRAAFEHTPAALDLQQRGRTLVDTIAPAVRSAGVPGFVPAVVLADPDPSGESFTSLLAIARRPGGGEGVLDRDQAGPSGGLILSPAGCPDVEEVCGFAAGAAAVIADGAGQFDLFIVQDTRRIFRRLVSTSALSAAYPAGSIVVEVDADTFRLETQPDGTKTLVRVTLAGAIQPVVDRVRDLSFRVTGRLLDATAVLDPATGDSRPWHLRTTIFMRNGS
jgi:prepilin-type N-terminal cleavage/methylation domain-containing protein